MASKSITHQIYEDFIQELEKEGSLDKGMIESLKTLLESHTPRKQDIVELLKQEGEQNEDPGA